MPEARRYIPDWQNLKRPCFIDLPGRALTNTPKTRGFGSEDQRLAGALHGSRHFNRLSHPVQHLVLDRPAITTYQRVEAVGRNKSGWDASADATRSAVAVDLRPARVHH